MYRKDLRQEERALLSGGGIAYSNDGIDNKFYSVEVLSSGMRQYNAKLKEVSQIRNVEFIDLASLISKDTTAFYDDVHFNENGSKMVADVIFEYLSQREPFIYSDNER